MLYLKSTMFTSGFVFLGNMCSVLIPGNTRVDPQYQFRQLTLDKIMECCVISITKSVTAGILWPLITVRLLSEIHNDPSMALNFLNLGYHNSPHWLAFCKKHKLIY